MEIRKLITEKTISHRNNEYENLINNINEDESYLNFDVTKLRVFDDSINDKGHKFCGNYDEVFIMNKDLTEVVAYFSVCEQHGFHQVKDNGLIVIYGHEEIILYFYNEEKYESIRTR